MNLTRITNCVAVNTDDIAFVTPMPDPKVGTMIGMTNGGVIAIQGMEAEVVLDVLFNEGSAMASEQESKGTLQ